MKKYIAIMFLGLCLSGCGSSEQARYQVIQNEFPDAIMIKHSGLQQSTVYYVKNLDDSIWEITLSGEAYVEIAYKNCIFEGTNNNIPLRLKNIPVEQTNQTNQVVEQAVLEKQ